MQIVGYDALDGGLLLSDADARGIGARGADGPPTGADRTGSGDDGAASAVEYVPLDPGTELSYALLDRHCAGTLHEGEHVACDASDAPYCHDHRRTWVCARCTGTCLKDEMDCFDDHAVYLAAFAPERFKVGVTKLWRLETRLREQGADRAAHVRTVEDGRIAREIEAGIAETIPDRVRAPAKRRGLHRMVDEDAWSALLDGFDPIETFSFDYGLDLDARPVAETIAAGTVRGTKGRLLVLDRAGSTYAVDLRDLVGYEVEPGSDARDLQSSLGAFG
ncbi:DUF2797 domain-containing protein [Halegenticoccus tardaugens]|uniref:DUF2797 domain-containing protein n=1 Tax=Halegenticoccus tardaugens TaxID=2071624 RepID=UPI00100B0F06|nr:DUF2797 domain-containing protein [Halegenticoccus tardaugens]